MINKITAAFLLWVMTMTAAMSQPGLRFCLCLNEVFVGECECVDLISEGTCPINDACSSGSCSPDDDSGQATAEMISLGCLIDLFVSLEDFAPTGSRDANEGSERTGDFSSLPATGKYLLPTTPPSLVYGSRGPPCDVIAPSVPLFIRHSVFLV